MTRDEAVEICESLVDRMRFRMMLDEAEAITTVLARLKEYEGLEAEIEAVELKDGDTLFDGHGYWKVDSQTPGDDSPNPEYPDLLSAWASVKEQKS